MNVKPVDVNAVTSESIAFIGIPFDDHSSFMKGPAQAPQTIREALHSPSAGMCTENIVDLSRESLLVDLGDLEVTTRGFIEDIQHPISRILERDAPLIILGGDHSITYPVLKAFGKKYDSLNVLQLDAHPDLYREYDGNPYSHACPFTRVMEDKLVNRLVQVGIRTMNPHLLEQARRFKVETHYMNRWDGSFKPVFDGPVYISLCLDALDPAFAPGVNHHEPGGFSTRDVIDIIQNLEAPLVGADIVEFSPKRDLMGMTAMAAAKFFKEIAGKMLETQ
ncbi:MAG: agmatinase [bacterium]|nr:agmatinase [bacterium]